TGGPGPRARGGSAAPPARLLTEPSAAEPPARRPTEPSGHPRRAGGNCQVPSQKKRGSGTESDDPAPAQAAAGTTAVTRQPASTWCTPRPRPRGVGQANRPITA